ncbi:MAG: deoxyribose-phosphate aldolase [Bacteroidetes bacterium]|nr:deoxyribose-phosphate aldolase [Bacteroidota bacterium]
MTQTHAKNIKIPSSILTHLVSCIDLTSLNSTDDSKNISSLCEKGITNGVAAICIYPIWIKSSKKITKNTFVKTASVAGGFPSGQVPLPIKTSEVKYAIDHGADEIDYVFPRYKALNKKWDDLYEEIATIREVCGKDITLKIILETGELQSKEIIAKTTEVAIKAGADFIKTSTGKTAIGATNEAIEIICECILAHFITHKKMVGIKASGGISNINQALDYYSIVKNILGNKWLHKNYFRIGTSKLLDNIIQLNETISSLKPPPLSYVNQL